MKTDKFQFTIGVTKGYFHDNENSNVDFISLVDKCAREVETELGLYISFNIYPTTTLYKTEWGCPENGEKTYTLSAVRNPKFNDNHSIWVKCCLSIVDKMKIELEQSTVTAEFSEIELAYFSNNAMYYYGENYH